MSYFERLEEWSACFTHCLSGHKLNTWLSLLTNSVDDSYDVVKPLFLDHLGYDWDSCAKRISCLRSLHTYPMTNILNSLCLLLTRLLILQFMCSLLRS